ncbi:MAG: RNA polymerase sigma factor [Fuerstiella sp.]
MTGEVASVDRWVIRLRGEATRDDALSELRVVLMRGLSHALNGKGGGESFCEDVAQETLIRILEKLDQFAGRSKFTTWAMSIAIRIGTSHLRRKMFKDISLNAADSGENMRLQWAVEDSISVEQQRDQRAVLDKLKSLIATSLTDRQRQATEAIMHGMPVEEIATRSDSNRNAVYKLIHDARVRLKSGLESAGFTAEEVLTAFA